MQAFDHPWNQNESFEVLIVAPPWILACDWSEGWDMRVLWYKRNKTLRVTCSFSSRTGCCFPNLRDSGWPRSFSGAPTWTRLSVPPTSPSASSELWRTPTAGCAEQTTRCSATTSEKSWGRNVSATDRQRERDANGWTRLRSGSAVNLSHLSPSAAVFQCRWNNGLEVRRCSLSLYRRLRYLFAILSATTQSPSWTDSDVENNLFL